ncbi:MAG: hypothetical protein J6T51_00030 [Kiritimatiellae bacterium]|nr:hypothetical protein [Kiritimatiellia bacterium]
MTKGLTRCAAALALAAAAAGCGSSYAWRSPVPPSARTVSVPTFANESSVSGLGAAASRQLLREIQREGTFKVAGDDAALEIQGVVKKVQAGGAAYDRRTGMRFASFTFSAAAEVSVIDRRTRKVLVNNRLYTATAPVTSSQDMATARRDAAGRLMESLAAQVVDDLLNMKFDGEG